ncbi:hypothetical protein PVA19_15600, partial [Agrobacterium sp. CNPSo 3708]|uniref:hypothetical protein n=1 Tax=Agrobacterium sp. CNPSo 3708 TaxID=3028150 RepID=UPI0023649ECC
RPIGRTKDALSSLIYASCFPKIDSDFRADAVGSVFPGKPKIILDHKQLTALRAVSFAQSNQEASP